MSALSVIVTGWGEGREGGIEVRGGAKISNEKKFINVWTSKEKRKSSLPHFKMRQF
jgi:hypothetical protein